MPKLFEDPSGVLELLRAHNFKPNDLLGQNFMLDPLILEQIADAADLKKTDQVLEIGSGIGNLTALLADRAEFVLGVEKDPRYYPILRETLGQHLQPHESTPKTSERHEIPENVKIVFADVMRFNFQELLKPEYKVVANIPYYITGKIVEMLLAAKKKPSKIVLLMQKEVAERIVAEAGQMSILAISVQLFSEPKMLGIVGKEKFYPKPKVDSAILVLDILPQPRYDLDQKKFFSLVKAAFSGKRKQLHNTLKNNLHLSEAQLDRIFKQGFVLPTARAQELSLQQWHQLYEQIFISG